MIHKSTYICADNNHTQQVGLHHLAYLLTFHTVSMRKITPFKQQLASSDQQFKCEPQIVGQYTLQVSMTCEGL